MKIHVRSEHIDNAVQANSTHCMIADAIKAGVPNAQYILVDLQSIRWTNPAKGERYIYLTPAIAQHNILKFDRGDKTIKPFTFSLNGAKKRAAGWLGQRSKGAKRPTAKKATSKAHKEKYAYLAKNRAMYHDKERVFGLRKFVE